jgi:hypothetical protein
MEILGVDTGGSGIKGASVDIATGALTAESYRLPLNHVATRDSRQFAERSTPCRSIG